VPTAPSGLDLYWYWPFPAAGSLAIADAFVDRGHRLVVESLATRFGEPLLDDLADPPRYTTVRDLPEAHPKSERSVSWLADRARVYAQRANRRRRVVRSHHFDVAYLQSLNVFTDAAAVAELRRHVPVVGAVHDLRPHHRRLPAGVQDRVLGLLYRQLDGIVVSHEWLAEELRDQFGVNPANVAITPFHVPERFQGDQAPVFIERAADEPVRVLFLGVFRRNKGLRELVDAVASLGSEPGMQVRIAGRGPDDMEHLVRDAARTVAAIDAEVGFVTEDRKDELLAGADLVVLPYTSLESQSAVLADAYAYRVPVVVTDVGGVGRTVRHDDTGWVVAPGDTSALADALVAATTDDAARAERRARLDALVPSRRLHHIVDAMEALFVQVTTDRGAPRR
jgi:glycosyltransferase involved in cell wall biosynthesis